jgi:HAD superfamily hydrolase (TIGR01549 family)
MLGGPPVDAQRVLAEYASGPPAVILARLLGRDLTEGDEAQYYHKLRSRCGNIRPYPGIVELLESLHGIIPLGVFTGASCKAAEVILHGSALRHYFAAVVGGDECARAKPAGDGVALAAQRLGFTAQNVCYIGDSPLDLLAAKDAGALAIGAAWGHQFDRSAPADVVLTCPTDLRA